MNADAGAHNGTAGRTRRTLDAARGGVARTILARAFMLLCLVCLSAVAARAGITVTPTTWNVIGLDSNKPTTQGPDTFQIGARACNTGATALTNLTATFVWDSANAFINLSGASTQQSRSLAAGACVDFYFQAVITRNSAAFDTARRYHITVTADGGFSASTPTPRELYVEHMVSQGRNNVTSITGPTTVNVGQTYQYTINSTTAPGGYPQFEAFLNLSNVVFQVLSIQTTYTTPAGATNDKFYADACGWQNNPTLPNYRSCVGPANYVGGKAGDVVSSTYTVKIVGGSGTTTTAGSLILDFSGSSYHYDSGSGITVTVQPPQVTLSKIANPTTALTSANVSYTLRLTNTGASAYTITDFTDTLPTSPAQPTYVTNTSAYNGAAISNPSASGATLTWSGTFTVPAGASRDLTYTLTMPATSGSYVNSAVAHIDYVQIDTTATPNDNSPASATVSVIPRTSGLTITPDAGTRPSVVQGQATALFNFRVTNTGNFTDQVRFLANGASARVTGPAAITDIVIDTDGSQTVTAADTDIKNNAADVLSAPLAPSGFINVIVRILVDLTATQGDAITVTLGDAATGGPTFDDQAANSSANEVRTVSTASSNGLREARGDMTALVDNDAQIFVNMTVPGGPVPLGSDITYTLNVSNPGLRDLSSQTLTNAPAGLNSGVFIIDPIPPDTVLKSGQVFPAGTLYTTSPLSVGPLTAVWTTTLPADLTTLTRVAFNVGPTLAVGASSASINLTVTITTNDATNPIRAIADAFGRNSLGAGLTDQTGDISRSAGDGNANFNEGPLRGTIDGDGVIQLTTLQAVGGVLLGPLGQPGAVGPTNSNDDYTNRSVTAGIAGVAPGGTTTVGSTLVFTNTLRNTGNAADTFTLTAPTVPAGFTVEISTDGGATYTTLQPGNGSASITVGFGASVNVLVLVIAPSGIPVLAPYAAVIRATSTNTPASFNDTIDRVYTGYVRLDKTVTVSNATGIGGATDPVSGAVITCSITYTNVSSTGGTNNVTLTAYDLVITEDGNAPTNNWGATTDHFVGATDTRGGTITGDTGSSTLLTDTIPVLAPGQSGVFTFKRTIR
ncbi:MAG: beta strand repeat-containing protein [Pyrinomonadaceae bacterium]